MDDTHCMRDDDKGQPKAIGHQSDSWGLKISHMYLKMPKLHLNTEIPVNYHTLHKNSEFYLPMPFWSQNLLQPWDQLHRCQMDEEYCKVESSNISCKGQTLVLILNKTCTGGHQIKNFGSLPCLTSTYSVTFLYS